MTHGDLPPYSVRRSEKYCRAVPRFRQTTLRVTRNWTRRDVYPSLFEFPFNTSTRSWKPRISAQPPTLDPNVFYTVFSPKGTLVSQFPIFNSCTTASVNPKKHTSSPQRQRSAVLLAFVLPIVTSSSNARSRFPTSKRWHDNQLTSEKLVGRW